MAVRYREVDLPGRGAMTAPTLCGTCDLPISLERDSIFGINWVHAGGQPACIPRDKPSTLANPLVATPHRINNKRRDYALMRSKEIA